jgi:hypothetical protein
MARLVDTSVANHAATITTVSYTDPQGLRHFVTVQAKTLYEAVAL